MARKTLVDVIYTPKQQSRLRKVWAGRVSMTMIQWIGSLMYLDILWDSEDFRRAAGVIQ